MKKYIALILAIALFACLAAGCSSAGSGKKALKVAISPDFAPMEFVDPTKTGQDKFVGFDVSLAKFIAQELDMTLEIMPMDFDACQAAVASGKVDMRGKSGRSVAGIQLINNLIYCAASGTSGQCRNIF